MLTLQCFYDGPKPKTDPFAEFMKIEHNTVSGGGDTVGHESRPANAPSNRMYSAASSMISPAHGQSQPGPQSEESFSELQEYSSYEDFDQQFSFINEVLDTN